MIAALKKHSSWLLILLAANCWASPELITPQFGGGGAVVYPVMSPRLSSKFGLRKHPVRKVSKHHSGVDLAAPENSPIRAIQKGVVVFADDYEGYGKLVVVLHKDGTTSHYGHCSRIIAHTGKQIRAGEIIAEVGSTGISTGPHLHFEIRKEGKPLDPLKLLPDLAIDAEG